MYSAVFICFVPSDCCLAFLAYDYNQVSQILQSSSTVLYSEVGYKGMVGISKLKRFLTGGR